jgi:hypothetical protein
VSRGRFLLVFGLVLALRIAVAARFRGNFDTQSFLIVVQGVLTGQNLYVMTDRYNSSPVWAFVSAGLWKASASNVGAFVLLIGLLQIAADAVSSALLVRIGQRRLGLDADEARRRALLFFSNPISVLISCAYGQFDGLSILCLLGALRLSARAPSRTRDRGVTAMLSLSLLVKHVTLFHPLLFSRRRDPRAGGLPDALVAAPYVVFAASFLPYAGALGAIVDHVVLSGSRSGAGLQKPGGIQAFLHQVPEHRVVFPLVLLAGVAWVLWETRRWELSRACLALFLALLVFSPSWAVQYLVWPAALGALHPSAGYGIFTLAGALYYSSAPDSLAIPWPVRATPLGTWVAAAFWLGAEVVRARREPFGDPNPASRG